MQEEPKLRRMSIKSLSSLLTFFFQIFQLETMSVTNGCLLCSIVIWQFLDLWIELLLWKTMLHIGYMHAKTSLSVKEVRYIIRCILPNWSRNLGVDKEWRGSLFLVVFNNFWYTFHVWLLLFRFIFVNFNAWEYAGSDNLWAGIATKLSDAVESEFGTMICRLFRIFDIETVSHDAGNPDVDDKMFFVKFRRDSPPMSIHEILQNYGVVRKVSLYHKWCEEKAKDSKLVSNLRDWWVVEYSNFREALSARTFLSRAGIAVNTVDPSGIQNGNGACVQDSQNIRANTSETDKEKLVSDETAIWGGESTVRNQNDNLNFCKHFRKYPKKVCKFPKLYWTILFIVSAVTIPLIVYLLAVRLNLEIFRVSLWKTYACFVKTNGYRLCF